MSIVINGMDMPKGNSTKNLLIYSDGRVSTGHKDDINYFAEELPSAQPDVPDINVGDMISRQAACEYCHEDRDGYITPIEKNGHAFIRFGMDGWCLELGAKGWYGEAKIKYCPMCGRELGYG